MSSGKRKKKKFSERLKETRKKLGLNQNEMAFILGMAGQTYNAHERGAWDNTYSNRKDRVLAKLVYLDREIEDRMALLQKTLEKVRKMHPIYTPRKNGVNKKLQTNSL